MHAILYCGLDKYAGHICLYLVSWNDLRSPFGTIPTFVVHMRSDNRIKLLSIIISVKHYEWMLNYVSDSISVLRVAFRFDFILTALIWRFKLKSTLWISNFNEISLWMIQSQDEIAVLRWTGSLANVAQLDIKLYFFVHTYLKILWSVKEIS